VLILLAGAALRFVLWWAFRNAPVFIADEKDYDALARTLAETGEFAFEPGGTLTSLRPPLYPLMVAAIYQIAGVGNLAAVRLVQALLSLVTAALLYRFGRAVLSTKGALWLTALFVLYPSFLGYTGLILTETLFTLLLVAAVYCTVRTLQRASIGLAWAAGLLLGLAALTRSVVWLAPPFVAVFVAIMFDGRFARRVAAAVAVVIGFAVVVGPWAIRNTRLQETFIAVDCMGGRNFMMGNYRHTPLLRSWDAVSITGEEFWANELVRNRPDDDRSTQGKLDKLALRHGLEFVRENPGLTVMRDVLKFFDFWGLERELVAAANQGFFGPRSLGKVLGLALVICGAYAFVIFAGAFGLACSPPADRRVTWLLVCVIAFVCGLHTLTFAHSRYHLPVMPFMMVFAASALAQTGRVWGQRHTLRFGLASAACLLLAAAWLWRFANVDRDVLFGPVQSVAVSDSLRVV